MKYESPRYHYLYVYDLLCVLIIIKCKTHRDLRPNVACTGFDRLLELTVTVLAPEITL